jgi:hypothetical protein
MLVMTQHARTRIQQRGIPEATVENLVDLGREAYDHHGSVVVLIGPVFLFGSIQRA